MKKLVVLTGAGISAESGLKTFRDSDGLWEGHRVEDVATPHAWRRNPALVLQFYNSRRQAVAHAAPNAAHITLARLQKDFHVQIITQNIDDLHERAGSKNVLHLHGEIFKMRSEKDESRSFPITGDINVGDRAEDGGQLRPHIVWFEEPVPAIDEATAFVSQADIFIIVGTSLMVYPAAGLVHYSGNNIPKFIVDRKVPPTPGMANLTVIEQSASSGMAAAERLLLALK